jgi:hypothetical protein
VAPRGIASTPPEVTSLITVNCTGWPSWALLLVKGSLVRNCSTVPWDTGGGQRLQPAPHIGSQMNAQGAASARLQHRQISGGLGVDDHAKAQLLPGIATSTAWSAVICRKTPVLGPPL